MFIDDYNWTNTTIDSTYVIYLRAHVSYVIVISCLHFCTLSTSPPSRTMSNLTVRGGPDWNRGLNDLLRTLLDLTGAPSSLSIYRWFDKRIGETFRSRRVGESSGCCACTIVFGSTHRLSIAVRSTPTEGDLIKKKKRKKRVCGRC